MNSVLGFGMVFGVTPKKVPHLRVYLGLRV